MKDFSLKDLHKPDAQKLRRNLSAIINFAKYREEKLIAYTELQEKHEHLVSERHRLAKENEALQAELAGLQEERDAELPEVARVEAEIDMVYGENQSLNNQQATLSAEVRNLKQEANKLQDEASQLSLKLNSASVVEEDLKMQIVHSPQKVKAMLEDIAGAVEREKAALLESDKRNRDLTSRLDAASKIEKEVVRALSMMEEADTEIQKKKKVSKHVKALRAEVASQEHEISQLEATKQHLHRQRASLLERIERLKAQCDVKKQAAEGRVEEQLRHKEAIEADNAAAVAKLHENEAMIRAIEARALEIRESHETLISSVLEQYQGLRQAVADYHEEMEAVMNKLDQTKEQYTDFTLGSQALLDIR